MYALIMEAFTVFPCLWICLLQYFICDVQTFKAETPRVTYAELSSVRVKRQLYQQESPNLWSVQDYIRDSGSSIWGPSSSSGSGAGSGSVSWSGSGSGSGSWSGSGSGSGSWSDSGSGHGSGTSHGFASGYDGECPFPFSEVGSSCYYATCSSSASVTRIAATQFCQNYSSQLAIFADANQYVDALNYIRYKDPQGQCSYWLGGVNVNGTFQWTTGATMPVGTPFWGFNSPVNPTIQIYAILNKQDYYRIHNIANNQSGIYFTYPLCQYVSGTHNNNGPSGPEGGSVINTVINQAGGSSYRSVQNISQINTPSLNITVKDDFNTSSPINITVYPPQITYTYLEPEAYGLNTYGSNNYGSSNYGSNTYGSNSYGLPNYLSSIHSYSPTPTPLYQQGGSWAVRTHGKTEEATPQKGHSQAKADISYPKLYARIMNTMKLLMAKIEENNRRKQ